MCTDPCELRGPQRPGGRVLRRIVLAEHAVRDGLHCTGITFGKTEAWQFSKAQAWQSSKAQAWQFRNHTYCIKPLARRPKPKGRNGHGTCFSRSSVESVSSSSAGAFGAGGFEAGGGVVTREGRFSSAYSCVSVGMLATAATGAGRVEDCRRSADYAQACGF
jgi:hypothetical protein